MSGFATASAIGPHDTAALQEPPCEMASRSLAPGILSSPGEHPFRVGGLSALTRSWGRFSCG